MLAAAWRYRHFIASSVRNDFRSRFIRSRLGGLWMVIHPMVNAAIFALVLAGVMAAKLPGMADNRLAYPIHVMAGMLGWSLFAEVVGRCLTLFIDNSSLLRQLVFPRICLPLIVAGSAVINNLLLFGSIVVIFGVLGHPLTPALLWVPFLMLVPLALGLGVGLLLGVINVFVRDVGQVVPVLLQLGFWFTPIIYVPAALPPWVIPWLDVNPMTVVVRAYQDVMLHGTRPDLGQLLPIALLAFALLGASLFMFRRANAELADAL